MHSRSIVALALVAILPATAFGQKGRMATEKSPADLLKDQGADLEHIMPAEKRRP